MWREVHYTLSYVKSFLKIWAQTRKYSILLYSSMVFKEICCKSDFRTWGKAERVSTTERTKNSGHCIKWQRKQQEIGILIRRFWTFKQIKFETTGSWIGFCHICKDSFCGFIAKLENWLCKINLENIAMFENLSNLHNSVILQNKLNQ